MEMEEESPALQCEIEQPKMLHLILEAKPGLPTWKAANWPVRQENTPGII